MSDKTEPETRTAVLEAEAYLDDDGLERSSLIVINDLLNAYRALERERDGLKAENLLVVMENLSRGEQRDEARAALKEACGLLRRAYEEEDYGLLGRAIDNFLAKHGPEGT